MGTSNGHVSQEIPTPSFSSRISFLMDGEREQLPCDKMSYAFDFGFLVGAFGLEYAHIMAWTVTFGPRTIVFWNLKSEF